VKRDPEHLDHRKGNKMTGRVILKSAPKFSLPQYQAYMRNISASPKSGPQITPKIIMEQAPRYDQLDLKPGSLVVFRADVDGRDTEIYKEKLESNLPFLNFALEKGCNVMIVGHRRRPSAEDSKAFFAGDLEAVPAAVQHHNPFFSDVDFLSKTLGHPIDNIRNWLTPDLKLTGEFIAWINAAKSKTGKIVFLENDRLWPSLYADYNSAAKAAEKGDPAALDQIAEQYYGLGMQLQELGVEAYVFDAISAAKQACGSKSAFAPFVPQIAVGPSTLSELEAIDGLLDANVFCLSGAKVSEKLPAAVDMIKAGKVKNIITGGIVGFALGYVEQLYRGIIERRDEMLGALSKPEHLLHISKADIDGMIGAYHTLEEQGRLDPFGEKGGVLNPVDFRSAEDPNRILSFRSGHEDLPKPDELQYDIGPESIANMRALLDGQIRSNPRSILMVISGTPGLFEKEGYDAGFLALREQANKVLDAGGREIGTGSEGNLVCPRGEHVIAGGVSGMFAAGTTPAAFRVFFPQKEFYPII